MKYLLTFTSSVQFAAWLSGGTTRHHLLSESPTRIIMPNRARPFHGKAGSINRYGFHPTGSRSWKPFQTPNVGGGSHAMLCSQYTCFRNAGTRSRYGRRLRQHLYVFSWMCIARQRIERSGLGAKGFCRQPTSKSSSPPSGTILAKTSSSINSPISTRHFITSRTVLIDETTMVAGGLTLHSPHIDWHQDSRGHWRNENVLSSVISIHQTLCTTVRGISPASVDWDSARSSFFGWQYFEFGTQSRNDDWSVECNLSWGSESALRPLQRVWSDSDSMDMHLIY